MGSPSLSLSGDMRYEKKILNGGLPQVESGVGSGSNMRVRDTNRSSNEVVPTAVAIEY